jgi:hypothetical protein
MTHKLATAYNTIGILYGREEPGKTIIFCFDTKIMLIIKTELNKRQVRLNWQSHGFVDSRRH